MTYPVPLEAQQLLKFTLLFQHNFNPIPNGQMPSIEEGDGSIVLQVHNDQQSGRCQQSACH